MCNSETDSRMNQTLSVCPSTLAEGYTSFSPRALSRLFDGRKVSHVLPYDNPLSETTVDVLQRTGSGRISLSGVQTKFSMLIVDGTLQFASEGMQGRFILKPAPTSWHIFAREYCPANEHLTMQLADQVYGIPVAANALCFFEDGEPAYLTRRFDVLPDGRKCAMEDFASLGGFTRTNGGSDFKYCNASYEECADLIHRYVKASPVELLKFFRLVVFNYLISNDDAHLKNFSLVERAPGDYVLSPAYDLMNTMLHLSQPRIFALEKGLFREGGSLDVTQRADRSSFLQFGLRIGLPGNLVERELDRFATSQPQVLALVHRSFLSESLKQLYIQSFEFRRSTLQH